MRTLTVLGSLDVDVGAQVLVLERAQVLEAAQYFDGAGRER